MNTYLLKKAMIATAVTRGMKDLDEDPKRSVRRLCDLGRQFSKNRFHNLVFSVMQEVLHNEDSAYYDMVRSVLSNINHEAVREFGTNFGYMSWAYGAGRLRSRQDETGIQIPWTIMMRYDEDRELTIERMARIIEEGQSLGIYAYFIRQSGSASDSYEILELLERYKDCAFFWMRGNGRLTAAQIQMLKVCPNTVVSLPVEDGESLLTAALLRDQKIAFAMHALYRDETDKGTVDHNMEVILATATSMFFLIADDGTKKSLREECYNSRLEQRYPCIMMDYYGDAVSISRTLAEHSRILEIGCDGRIIRPSGKEGRPFSFDLPLLDALKECMDD